MKRIDTPYAEPDQNGPGRTGFLERTPPEPPTGFSDEWCNHVQEEIARAIELCGGTLDDEDLEQLGKILAKKTDGPASSDADRLAVFDGTTGKVLKQNTQRIDGHSLRLASDGVYGFTAARTRSVSIHPAALVPTLSGAKPTIDSAGNGGRAQLDDDFQECILDLSPARFPGTEIASIDVRILPGAARATVGNRITIELYQRSTLITAASATLMWTTVTDDGTATAQTCTLTGTAIGWADGYLYFLRIRAGNDGGSHLGDIIGGIKINISQTETW